MTVLEAYEILRELIAEGKGDLPIYTEYEKLHNIREKVADETCDGCQLELEPGAPFVELYIDH